MTKNIAACGLRTFPYDPEHREYAGEIRIRDFDTSSCSLYRHKPFTQAESKNRQRGGIDRRC